MSTTEKEIHQMDVKELVDELLQRFKVIYSQLNFIQVQTSLQNKRILEMEGCVGDIRSLSQQMRKGEKSSGHSIE